MRHSSKAIDVVDGIEAFAANVERIFVKPDRSETQMRMVHAVLGAGGEVGELTDAVKKHWIYGQRLDVENVREEIGDTLFYLQALAAECGVSLVDCMAANVAKLQQRYPDGYTDAAAKERRDKQSV